MLTLPAYLSIAFNFTSLLYCYCSKMVKKHSGAFNRQKKKENATATAKVLAKTPKLFNYFQKNVPNLSQENVQNDCNF